MTPRVFFKRLLLTWSHVGCPPPALAHAELLKAQRAVLFKISGFLRHVRSTSSRKNRPIIDYEEPVPCTGQKFCNNNTKVSASELLGLQTFNSPPQEIVPGSKPQTLLVYSHHFPQVGHTFGNFHLCTKQTPGYRTTVYSLVACVDWRVKSSLYM